ncbi:hypothetical protein Tco_0935080 [Tanacetum coccineum]
MCHLDTTHHHPAAAAVVVVEVGTADNTDHTVAEAYKGGLLRLTQVELLTRHVLIYTPLYLSRDLTAYTPSGSIAALGISIYLLSYSPA